jgi:oxalate decarboxylase
MSTGDIPQPIRGALGASSVGPRNIEIDRQNPDLLASPDTDHGSIPNLKFSFSLAHNRLLEGGWAREVTIRELPAATSMAGVNMRLGPGTGLPPPSWLRAWVRSGADGYRRLPDVQSCSAVSW